MINKSELKIKKSIVSSAETFFDLVNQQKKFIAGETFVPATGKSIGKEELVNSIEACMDMWYTAGRFADEFEKDFSSFLGSKSSALVNSGSSANLLAIASLTSPKLGERKINKGDEVITVAGGFPTTIAPIIQVGLVPVFVDIEVGTYNIDVSKIEDAITKKTKAIMIAHTLGNPFNLEKILEITKKHGLFLIEDNCDALGSRYNGKNTGTFGDISTSSFYPAHHITMGEGGAVNVNNRLLSNIVISLRDWGRDCWCNPGNDNTCNNRFSQQHGTLPFGYDHKYVYSHLGYNLKVTDMQAAIGLAQLKKLPDFIKTRKQNADLLMKELKKYENYFILPIVDKKADANWFSFPLTVREDAPFDRLEITEYLESNKIGTRLLFAGNMTRQPVFAEGNYDFRTVGDLTSTDIVMERMFSIGCFSGIGIQELTYILEMFDKFIKRY